MKISKKRQIYLLKKILGQKSDLIDLEARVDGRLSFQENKHIILKKASQIGISKKTIMKFKGSPIYYRVKAENINSKRNIKQRAKDGSTTAKHTFNDRLLTYEQFILWKKNPRRFDIMGVDSRGEYNSIHKRKEKKLTLKDINNLDLI